MLPEPMAKSVYNQLVEAGVTTCRLSFSGGSDEGYLSVTLEFGDDANNVPDELLRRLDKLAYDWAWSVYDYCGAGDGNDYGDEIVYDLTNNKVETSEWYTTTVSSDTHIHAMCVVSDNQDEGSEDESV